MRCYSISEVVISTEQRILEGARRAFVTDAHASMDDVASAADVGRATVFRLFGDRAGLLRALAKHSLDETERVAREAVESAMTASGALEALVRAVVGVGESFQFLVTASSVFDDPELEAQYGRQMAELVQLIEQCRAEGSIRADLPTTWVAASIDGQIWAAAGAVGRGEIGRVQAQGLAWEAIRGGLLTPRREWRSDDE